MTSERKALPLINPARCTGCGWCVAVCPPHVLLLQVVPGWQKKSTLHDATGCTGCALCALKCPFDAIAMQRIADLPAALGGASRTLGASALRKGRPTMTDWKLQQMIKASGWPLAPETLGPGADFNARLEGGLVPLHWACAGGKAGMVKHMIEHGANVQDAAADGQTPLAMALQSGSYQVVMLVIDRLKALGAAPPDAAQRQRLSAAFAGSHTDARNRLQQTLRDWDRIAKQAGAGRVR